MEPARKLRSINDGPSDELIWRRAVAARPEAAHSLETIYCVDCNHPVKGVRGSATDPLTGRMGAIHEGCIAVEGIDAGEHAAGGCEACISAIDREWVGPFEPAYEVHWQDFEPNRRS